MNALLFSLGIILVCVVLLAVVTRHMVKTVMKMYDELLDWSLMNYGINRKNKEDNNDSDRT